MSERLEAISAAAAQGADPEELIAQLEALHQEVLEDPAARATFEREVLSIAEGLYLPHIFWIYLSAFLQDKESYRPFLEYILQVFAQQPSSAFIEKRMKPLLYVYLSEEAPFYLNRLWDYLRRYARADKYEFMDNMRSFVQKNPSTVDIFRKKFHILGSYMPDFEAMTLPLSQIQASFSQSPTGTPSE
ncbi:MAG: hypothetical protein N2170_05930 [Bacteroidia bacterium]|nr:hypothetical protein [Bacteroidia bacterium]